MGTDRLFERLYNPQPVFDPDPIPNIVLHPGDTLAFSQPNPANPAEHAVRLCDRDGHCYAVLDCDPIAHGVRIHAIRFVAAPGRQEGEGER